MLGCLLLSRVDSLHIPRANLRAFAAIFLSCCVKGIGLIMGHGACCYWF